MPHLSLGQAAKEAGVSKATISKALKIGKLSYVAKTTAGYEIDPAELFRVFPPKPLGNGKSERSQTPDETAQKHYDEVVELLRAQVRDLQADRDAWREQAQQAQRLLAAPALEPDAEAKPRRRWFGR